MSGAYPSSVQGCADPQWGAAIEAKVGRLWVERYCPIGSRGMHMAPAGSSIDGTAIRGRFAAGPATTPSSGTFDWVWGEWLTSADAALREWWHLIRPAGHLMLTWLAPKGETRGCHRSGYISDLLLAVSSELRDARLVDLRCQAGCHTGVWRKRGGPGCDRLNERTSAAVRAAACVPGLLRVGELGTLALRLVEAGARNVIEIGSWQGRSACLAASLGARVLCVDDFSLRWGRGPGFRTVGQERIRSGFHRNTLKYREQGLIRLVECDSATGQERIRRVAVEHFKGLADAAFIDGSHDYASVASDLTLAVGLVDPDGLVIGHDIDMTGVRRAVAERFGSRVLPGRSLRRKLWWVWLGRGRGGSNWGKLCSD